jgi:uncharacterized protein
MYTGALENHPELVDAMAAVAPLWGNAGPVLRDVRSPWHLAEALRENGLLFPETVTSSDGLARDGSWLAKTGRGASGTGVRAWSIDNTGATGLACATPHDALAAPVAPRGEAPFYQRRVTGEPFSAVFVAADSSASLLGVVRQLVGEPWLGAGQFQYCGAIGPWPLDSATVDQIARIGAVIARRFRLVGLFGADLVIDGQRVWCIEVNPRYTASVEVVERAIGIHAIAGHAAACTEQRLPSLPTASAGRVCGKAILFAKECVTIPTTFADWATNESQRAVWPGVADLSPAGTIVEAAHPIMTALAAGATTHSVVEQLRVRVATIERALYSQRPLC